MIEEVKKLYGAKLSFVGVGVGRWLNQALVSHICSDGVVFVPEISENNMHGLAKQVVGILLDRLRRFSVTVEAGVSLLGIQSLDGQPVSLLADDQADLMDLGDNASKAVKFLACPNQTFLLCIATSPDTTVRLSLDGTKWCDVSLEPAGDKKQDGVGVLGLVDPLFLSRPTSTLLSEYERMRHITNVSLDTQIPSTTCRQITVLKFPDWLKVEAVLCDKFDEKAMQPLLLMPAPKTLPFVSHPDPYPDLFDSFFDGAPAYRSFGPVDHSAAPTYRSLSAAAPTSSAVAGHTHMQTSDLSAESWAAKFKNCTRWSPAQGVSLKEICEQFVDHFTIKKNDVSVSLSDDVTSEVEDIFGAMKKRATSPNATGSSHKAKRASEKSSPNAETGDRDNATKLALLFLREVCFVNLVEWWMTSYTSREESVLSMAKFILANLYR